MIANIAGFQLLGKPLIFYTGILTLLSLLITAFIGYGTVKGVGGVKFKHHPIMAKITVILALIHGLMGFSLYFHF